MKTKTETAGAGAEGMKQRFEWGMVFCATIILRFQVKEPDAGTFIAAQILITLSLYRAIFASSPKTPTNSQPYAPRG